METGGAQMDQLSLSHDQIIDILYRHFLGRKPDARGLSNFREALAEGRMDVTSFIGALLTCDEYRQREMVGQETWVPPGHFYSPIVNLDELRIDTNRIFDRSRIPLSIDLNEAHQLALLNDLAKLAQDLPFTATKHDGLHYYYDNPSYSYGDALVLAAMIRHARPKRVVEFGCGFSSCVILDVNRLYFDGEIECSFVDPYPELLQNLVGKDYESLRVFRSRTQDVDLALVESLEDNDILFIDSTHVSKAGSDVNFHFFETLPKLKPGVYIHFHDVFYPFEYPDVWFFDGNRSWNEIYLLKAFLMYNHCYKIEFFNDFFAYKFRDLLFGALPQFRHNTGGAIWLRKYLDER
jgi:hypothetical protein